MKTIYYSDPLHDDFANNGIKSKPLRIINISGKIRYAAALTFCCITVSPYRSDMFIRRCGSGRRS